MDKIKIGGIIAVVAVLILVISLGMPWYTTTREDEEGETSTSRLSLDILPWVSQSDEYSSMGLNYENRTTTMTITSILATVGTSVSMISLLFIGMAMGTGSKKHTKIGSILLVIGLIFAIVAPIYMMFSWPGAMLDDSPQTEDDLPDDRDTRYESFFGSHSPDESDSKQSWGGGIGWFMSLIGGILLVVSVIFIFLGGKRTPPRGRIEEQQPTTQKQQRGWEQPAQQQQPSHQQPSHQQPSHQQPPTQQQRSQGRGRQEPSQQQPPTQQQRSQGRGRQQPSQQQPPQQQQSQVPGRQQPPQQQPPQQQPPQQQQSQGPGRQEPSQQQPPTPGVTEEPEKTCSTCGQELRYVDDYDRWYCDNCQEFR